MTRRNQQNARYTTDKPKGMSRKSSGSAKLKSTAGSSVRVASPSAKQKRKEAEAKERERIARAASRDKVTMQKAEGLLDSVKKWKRVWLVLIVVAVIAVAVSWVGSYVMTEGGVLGSLSKYKSGVLYVGMTIGYACIIGALVVDFKFVRPVRKAQEALLRKESKKQRKHSEEAVAKPKRSFFKRKEN